jgi:hypothetical protein
LIIGTLWPDLYTGYSALPAHSSADPHVRAGDWVAGQLLPDLLAEQGRGDDAARLQRFGLNPDGSISRG